MNTLTQRPATYVGQTASRTSLVGAWTARTLSGRLLSIGRDRWPLADFRDHHDRIRWTDGPNYSDVFTAAAQAGIAPDDLDRAGIALQRTVSARILAYATLAAVTPDIHLSRAQGLVDDLLRFPTPASGAPAIPDPPADLDRLWHRAASLAHLDGDRPPIPADDRDAILGELRRLKMLTAMAGPDALDRGLRLIPAASIGPDSGATRITYASSASGDHRCAVRIERWPGRLFTAVTSLRDDRATPALYWIDGPTAEQVRIELERRGLPSPLEGCGDFTLHRSLSATAIAASVLLHQQLVGEPYRDTAIGHHWLQQWKVASVREIARREAPIRARLERIQHELLDRPLPATGGLTMTRRAGTPLTFDGEHLWARAEALQSLLQPRLEPDVGHTPGRTGSRQLSLALATLLASIGPAALDLLVPTPRS